MRFPFLPWVGVVAVVVSGCAFTDVSIHRTSGPIVRPSTVGQHRSVLIVAPFTNQRPQPRRCGMKKNGFGMDTADVLCEWEPEQSIAILLSSSLQACGVDLRPRSPTDDTVQIRGEVLEYFIEPVSRVFYVNIEADIHVRLTLTSWSGLIAERDFYVKGEEPSAFEPAQDYQSSNDSATRTIVLAMTKAIIQLFNQYPQLGRPVSPLPSPPSPPSPPTPPAPAS